MGEYTSRMESRDTGCIQQIFANALHSTELTDKLNLFTLMRWVIPGRQLPRKSIVSCM